MSKNKSGKVKVLYRSCSEMDHMIVSRDGVLLSDRFEGFPKLMPEDVLACLAESGVIELERETIDD